MGFLKEMLALSLCTCRYWRVLKKIGPSCQSIAGESRGSPKMPGGTMALIVSSNSCVVEDELSKGNP